MLLIIQKQHFTDASTISWNVLTSPVAKVTLGANRTLGAATGGIAGVCITTCNTRRHRIVEHYV